MFGISSFEFLIILLIGVVVLGPDKLPKVMRTFNKAMSEFRRIRTDLHRAVNLEIANQEHEERKREAEAELLREPQAASEMPTSPEAAPEDEPPISRPKTDSLHVNLDEFQAMPQPDSMSTDNPEIRHTAEAAPAEPGESVDAAALTPITETIAEPGGEKVRA